jgi:hypothetical protein
MANEMINLSPTAEVMADKKNNISAEDVQTLLDQNIEPDIIQLMINLKRACSDFNHMTILIFANTFEKMSEDEIRDLCKENNIGVSQI